MRIVGGTLAGRDLTSPAGRVRPTAEAVRVALLELVRDDLEGARVLDLFAGTGGLGLEALSRGAATCDFVENNASAIHALKANVAALRLRDRTRVFDRDAIPFVDRLAPGRYDIAFADPPYGSRKLDRVLDRWLETPFCRVLAIEHAADRPIRIRGKTKRVGETLITVLRAGARGERTGPGRGT